MENKNLKEEYKENYSFHPDDITTRDKEVVEEIIKLLNQRENIPIPIIIKELKIKFNLENIPELNIENSIWYKLTKDTSEIKSSIQGYKIINLDNGEKLKIPHLGFSVSLDDLNKFVLSLIEKIKKDI
jgi:hypothetical protein